MKTREILRIIRITIYIILIMVMIILKYTNIINWTCFINENFGILCPTCGFTRATEAILNLDFTLAVKHNAYYTLVLFPIFLIMFIDDVICIIFKKKSFVEIILGE